MKAPNIYINPLSLLYGLTLSEPLVKEFPDVPDYAAARARYLHQFGVATFLAGNPDRAVELLRAAVADQRRLAAQHPAVVAYGFLLSVSERALGRVLFERGEVPEARTWLRSAIDRLEALRKADPRLAAVRPQLGMAYRDLTRVLTAAGETALAAQARRQAQEFDADRGRANDPFAPRDRDGPRRP